MSYNPGLLFYRHYYESITFNAGKPGEKKNEKVFNGKNTILMETAFRMLTPADDFGGLVQHFPLTTTYPGLLIGTGYAHGSGMQGEFKTGFYFDHTTGMPMIPGSSVKGLLRSAFPGRYLEKAQDFEKKGKITEAQSWHKLAENRKKFIVALLNALGYGREPEFTIEKLEREIFEGMTGTDREKKDDHFPMRYRDVFMDAEITASADGKIFADEFITPHRNPLKNPVPLQLLKVRPGVTFSFRFILAIHKDDDGGKRLLTPAQRLELFRQILLFMGAGAKTNTGFGHFEDSGRVNLSGKKQNDPAVATQTETPLAVAIAPAVKKDATKLKPGHFVEGLVDRKENGILYILLEVDGYSKPVTCRFPSDRIQVGARVRVRVNNVQGRGDNFTIGVAEPILIS